MKSETPDPQWLKSMKAKVDEEVSRKELDTLLYWKGEIDKIMAKRHSGLATLQSDIQNLMQRMQNRIRIVKETLSRS